MAGTAPNRRACVLACVSLLALAAAIPTAHDPITTRVTWTGEIERIVQARCVTCHSPDGRGPMSLVTYQDARPWARAIKEEVMTRRMPKWSAVRGYGDFSNDPSLSPFEIALIGAWADGGAPRGIDPATRTTRTASPPKPEVRARHVLLPCNDQPLPVGTLVALKPEVGKDQSVGVSVRLPNGRREILAWIRNYDPEFSPTYWLRTPLDLPPGSVLAAESASTECSVTLSLREPPQ